MKRIEGFIIKVIIIQFIFLILTQLLLTQPQVAPYLSKVVYYEGVTKESVIKSLETSK